MSKFFVGQRVRVIGAPADPRLIGTETRITGHQMGTFRADCWVLDIPSDSGGFWLCAKDCAAELLAPIELGGLQASDQSFEQLMADLRKGVIHA